MGRRNESTRNKFLESPTHTAMLRTIFPEAAFIPKQRQVKVPVQLQSKSLHSNVHTLLDSGATDNFISPLIVNRFNIQTYGLPRPKVVRNVDGTKNSIGPMTDVVTLEVHYHNYKIPLCFYVMNLGDDAMLLGMPLLAAYNPEINWQTGIFSGDVIALTNDAHQWSSNQHKTYVPEDEEEYSDEEDDLDYEFIPSNERDMVQLGKATTATELAIQAVDPTKRTWQEQVPEPYHQFGRVFSDEESHRFPESRPWDHAIDLLPEAPPTLDCKVYPLPEGQQDALDRFLDEHLAKGYIRRSNSPYASPFFFVKKKDGKLRPVQDYRALNNWTIRNTYPLPLIKELITKLVKKKWFTKLDIRWGYNNVRIKDGDQWKTTFKTNRGLFECMVMFFGLTNSPATFQTIMDVLFHEEIMAGCVIVYMDDILIVTESDDIEDHIIMVSKVLKILQDNDLFLKPEKCHFHKREVEYLGILVGNGQVKMDPVKLKGMIEWPEPTNLREL